MQVKSGSVRAISLALLCLFVVIYPLFAGPGPVNTRGGGDSPFLLVRLEQLVTGLRAGAFPVRWMPGAAYGLGYPFFNFYAALPYYIAALLRLLGMGPILALQLTQALGFVLAAAAMALLARRIFRHPAAATLAIIAYTCIPFHLVNVYVRGDSLSEFYAFIFYPLIFWAMLRLRHDPAWTNVAWLALSYGGLLLTHNLSALMLTPFIIGYALFLLWPPAQVDKRYWQAGLRMLCGGLLGLALSASLWLTAFADLDAVWMGHKDIQTAGYFGYEGHLRGLDLVQPRLLFAYDVTADQTPFAMGAIQAVLTLLGITVLVAAWLRRYRIKQAAQAPVSWDAFWIAGFFASTFLITRPSLWLWDRLPVLPIVQFPWRFLSVQGFFGALILGRATERLPRAWWVAGLGTLLLVVSTVGGLQPEYLPIQEADVTPQNLALFELLTGNIGTTIRGEYLPRWVEPQIFSSAVLLNRGMPPHPMALEGTLTRAELVEQNARSQHWQIEVTSPQARLAFYTLFFPGWEARIDSQQVPIEPLEGSGLIAIRVPGGTHDLTLRFGRTPARWAADITSLIGLAVALVLAWPAMRRIKDLRWPKVGGTLIAAAILGAGILAMALLVSPRWQTADNDLSMDFERMLLLHHNPQGIDFGGLARLEGYTYSTGTVRGGDRLTVNTHWAALPPELTVKVQLVSPADAHPRFAPPPAPLAVAHAAVDATDMAHELPIPTNAASGLYYLALRVFDGENEVRAVTAQGHPLGTTYLRPLWVNNPRPAQETDPIQARFGEQIVLGEAVRVTASKGYWEIELPWQAVQPIPVNYACALRMLSADGSPLPGTHRDLEGGPGHGFWPTSAWPVGEWLTDRLHIAIPPGVQAGDAAALSVVLYDRAQPGFPAAGSAIIPLQERAHSYELPAMQHAAHVTFGEQITLLGYDMAQDEQTLHLDLYWQAGEQIEANYKVFVHLFDPATEAIPVQVDRQPLNGVYPTSWWRAGEVIADQVTLSIADLTPGDYALAVGIYDVDTDVRLDAHTAAGEPLPDGRLILKPTLSILDDE